MSIEYELQEEDQYYDVPECDQCGARGDETPLAVLSSGNLCELCCCTRSTDYVQQQINKALNIAVRQIRDMIAAAKT